MGDNGMFSPLGVFLRKYRKLILCIFDIITVTICYIAPWVFIQGRVNLQSNLPLLVSSCFLFVCCFEIVYGVMGMYDSLWRYAEVVEFFKIVLSSVIAVAIFIVLSLFIYYDPKVPVSVYFLSALFATSITLYSRLTYRMLRNRKLVHDGRQIRRVMVIGAGEAAASLLHEQYRNEETDMNIVCMVDDAKEKVGRSVMGVKILGTTEDVPELVEQCEIETILLAIPTLNDEDRKRILDVCAKTKCNLQILPDIRQMITDGSDLSSRIRDVRVEDLLGRDEIKISSLSNEFLQDRVVLVTGGGGSIGSELCRQIAYCRPKMLIILDIYENNAYEIQQELLRTYTTQDLNLVTLIASVRDSKKIREVFEKYRPQVVFHAAAHKHVPLMETSPEEAIKNNVCGTYNVAQAADKYGSEYFVLISTDKAVNPTNVMGATKRLCEMIVQSMAQKSDTSFVAVRFGNVLGSNGSVIPLFKEQIEQGGPVTVTHPDVVRYFMTIPEATSLVLEAAAMGKGGEIFVLDMGEPVKILDLAENLIKLAGFIPYQDIEIKFTGLRPGEKLYEELLMDEEGLKKTNNVKIFIGAPIQLNVDTFFDSIHCLKTIAYTNNSDDTIHKLEEMVPTFHHNDKLIKTGA